MGTRLYISDLSSSGGGDMFKSVYDPDNTGIVLSASKEMVSVRNKTGALIPKGTIVYLKTTSSSSMRPELLLASALNESTSSKTIGATYEDIADNGTGYIVTSGEVDNLDTSAYPVGTRLWLSATPGQVTSTVPTPPSHSVFIGIVTRSQNGNGRILYAVQNGFELEELHDVVATAYSTPVDADDLLIREDATSLWKRLSWSSLKTTLKTYFDAFYFPQKYMYRSFSQSIGSNTTGETQLLQVVIPANTFSATDKISFFATFSKTGVATNTTHRIKITTSPSMPVSSTNQIAQYASANTIQFTKINRELTISGGVLKGYPFVPSAVSDTGVSNNALNTVAFDVTQTQYLYISSTPTGTTTDITYLEAFEIKNF
jgi:hypothetical protein